MSDTVVYVKYCIDKKSSEPHEAYILIGNTENNKINK